MVSRNAFGGNRKSWFLDCAICFDVLRNPQKCVNGHNFCLSCITESLKVNSACPCCRVSISGSGLVYNDALNAEINRFKVKCANHTVCDWTGILGHREGHLSHCLYQPVDCPWFKHRCCIGRCNGKILRKDHAQHLIDVKTLHHEEVMSKMLTKLDVLSTAFDLAKEAVPSGYTGSRVNGVPQGVCIMKDPVYETFQLGTCTNNVLEGFSVWVSANYTYFGNFRRGRQHGQGTAEYADGKTYVGEWSDGSKHGRGCFTDPVGNIYDGQFVNGKMTGRGITTLISGDVYEGPHSDGRFHGLGVMKYRESGNSLECHWNASTIVPGLCKLTRTDGSVYSGSFIVTADDDQIIFQGHGLLNSANGDVYEGEFVGGQYHGMGKITYRTIGGELYEGQWERNLRHGHGRMFQENGDTYDGQFVNDIKHGHGVMVHANGDVYTGNWNNNKKCGIGRMKFNAGAAYLGGWMDNAMVGYGIYRYSAGGVYTGCVRDGLRHGSGEMRWINGSTYKGQWCDGNQHGLGAKRDADGAVHFGKWQRTCKHGTAIVVHASGDVFVGDYADNVQCRGKMRYINGVSYDGQWKDGKPHGQGVMTRAYGTVQRGEWNAGEFRITPVAAPAAAVPSTACVGGPSSNSDGRGLKRSAAAVAEVVDLTADDDQQDRHQTKRVTRRQSLNLRHITPLPPAPATQPQQTGETEEEPIWVLGHPTIDTAVAAYFSCSARDPDGVPNTLNPRKKVKPYRGTVTKYAAPTAPGARDQLYHVLFEDGDEEDWEQAQMDAGVALRREIDEASAGGVAAAAIADGRK